jgi:hypothetical protein
MLMASPALTRIVLPGPMVLIGRGHYPGLLQIVRSGFWKTVWYIVAVFI